MTQGGVGGVRHMSAPIKDIATYKMTTRHWRGWTARFLSFALLACGDWPKLFDSDSYYVISALPLD